MIRESHVDSSLNRLSKAFGAALVIRPPAAVEEIAKIEQLVGALPREYAIFLVTCNGLRIRTEGTKSAAEWHFWNAQEIVASILSPMGPGSPQEILPFCGDVTSARDCLVTAPGKAHGTVVRWDPWANSAELLASGFGHYLDRWTDFAIGRFAPHEDGAVLDEEATFDAGFISSGDSQLPSLREQTALTEWLRQLDHVVASGDDFE